MSNKMEIVQIAHTNVVNDGWAIALLRGLSRRDGVAYYEVVRMAPDSVYLTLYRTRDEKRARELANAEWASGAGGAQGEGR